MATMVARMLIVTAVDAGRSPVFKRKQPYTTAEIHQYVQDISELQAQRADMKGGKLLDEQDLAIETAQWYLNFMLDENRHWAEKKAKGKR